MTIRALRGKLSEYIKVADEKKLKAIYDLLEEEIEETVAWWKDKSLLSELNEDYAGWKSGKAKGHSVADVEQAIDALRKDG